MTPVTRSLLRAAAIGDVSVVKSLLAQDTDANCVTAAGQTPLMLAAGFGHEAVVTVLLNAGAFVSAQDELGLTAMDWAKHFPRVLQLIQIFAARSQPAEADNEEKSTDGVEIKPPVTRRTRSPVLPETRVTLPGLAGAILRDRETRIPAVVQTTNTSEITSPETVTDLSMNGPDVRGDEAPVTTDEIVPYTSAQQTEVVDESIRTRVEEQIAEPQTFADPLEFLPTPRGIVEPEESVAPEPVPASLPVKERSERRQNTRRTFGSVLGLNTVDDDIGPEASAPDSDDTLSGPLAPAAEETKSAKRVKPLVPVPATEYQEPPRTSKVEVNVPSFGAVQSSSWKPLLWILIFLFLGTGAYLGYRFRGLVLDRTANQVVGTPAVSNSPPPVEPTKAPPVVAGDLAGAELYVPDADYPAEAGSQGGKVVVNVQANRSGIVYSAKAVDGPQSLRSAAEKASKRSAFFPEKLAGKKSVISGTITYSFAPPNPAQPKVNRAVVGAEPKAGGPLSGAALNLQQPSYPSSARRANLTGTVTLLVRVNRNGHVVSWRTLDGDARLKSAAISAARQSTFSPDKLPGDRDVLGTITYSFVPDDRRQ